MASNYHIFFLSHNRGRRFDEYKIGPNARDEKIKSRPKCAHRALLHILSTPYLFNLLEPILEWMCKNSLLCKQACSRRIECVTKIKHINVVDLLPIEDILRITLLRPASPMTLKITLHGSLLIRWGPISNHISNVSWYTNRADTPPNLLGLLYVAQLIGCTKL